MKKLFVAGASLLALSACNTVERAWTDRDGYYTRNLPDLNDNDARQFAERQNNLWNCFVSMAQAGVAHDFRQRDSAGASGGDSFHNRDSKYDCTNKGAVPNVIKSEKDLAGVELAGADIAVPEATATPPVAAVPDGERGDDANGNAPAPPPPPPPGQPAPVAPTVYPLERSPTYVAGRFRPLAIAGDHPSYSEVVAAGIHYVDVRCDRFIDALFWFNRMRETTSRQVQFIGAASAAVATILNASTELIGLAPLGIGLVDQTVNNIGRGLLYDLPPHVVRQLVERQQQAYLKGIAKEYTSRPHAMQTIQGYAALCLPATIETEVNRAVAAAEYKPIPWENPLKREDWVAAAKALKGKKDEETADAAGNPVTAETTVGTPPPNHVPSVEQTDDDDDD